jgi:predicted nucleic acid-binding protein
LIVLDASAALAIFLDEREHADDELFETIADQQVLVPAHWHAEIGNALTMNLRRGRLTSETFETALANLRVLKVATQPIPEIDDIAGTVRRAVEFGLTYYDELYVRLAEIRSIPLFTFDTQMRNAALRRSVATLPA